MANNSKRVLADILTKLKRSKSKYLTKTFLKKTSKYLENVIRDRVRDDGRGVRRDGGNRIALKGLKQSTKDYRTRYSKNLHGGTSPSKSNLTATGKLLDAITGSSKGDDIQVSLIKTRRGSTLSGGKDKSNNHTINEAQEDMGRSFMYVSKTELADIERLAKKQIDKELKKLLK